MPRRAKGPRLYRDKRRDQWVIRDGTSFARTGCAGGDLAGAEKRLAQYISSKHRPASSDDPRLSDVLRAYAAEVAAHRRTAVKIGYNVGNLARWWGDRRASDVTARSCRDYAASKPAQAAGADLKTLQAALRHWHAEYGPLPSLPRLWRPPGNAPRERWLTRSEAARLLRAARHTPHIARMVLLGLRTGSRPGVIKALEWSWLDLERGVMHRRAPGELERGNKRTPPVRLGQKIIGHLKRWRRIDGGQCPWVVHWRGRPLDDPHWAWKRVVTQAGLPGITPHVLRHTRATWLMQAGIDLWDAAGSLGMSVRMLEAVYGHHHPSHQGRAADV